MFIIPVILIAVIVYALYKMNENKNSDAPPKGSSPKDIIDERYAKGEINTEQYKELLENLKK